jgi:hypothetical protein
MRVHRALGGLGFLLLALGALLLSEPLRHPVFTKLSVFMVGDRPLANPRGPGSAPRTATLEDASDFLGPGVRWAQIVAGSGERFSSSGAESSPLPPVAGVGELIDAVFAGEGVCNNWTEALMVLCADAGRACREWAHIPYPDAPDTGHAVVDIWLPEQQRWAMLDAYVGFWARGVDGAALSAPEFERALLAGASEFAMLALGDRKLRIGDIHLYYGDRRSWLVEVVRNDPGFLAQHWTRSVERVSKPLGQLLQWALGISPLYLVPDDEVHRELRRHMRRFRRRLAAGSGTCGLGLLLVICAARGSTRPGFADRSRVSRS